MPALPKVTIMIPTYNQAHMVSRAIESALAQTYPNLEIIVSDDASPDNTAEVVARYNDPRLRYCRNEQNLGRVRNYRHTLYDLATGEWVVNLDGDDYFTDPEFINAAIEMTKSATDVLIIAARIRVISKAREYDTPSRPKRLMDGKEVILHYDDTSYTFYHLAALYNRQAALATNFYSMDVIGSDSDSMLRLALKGGVAYLDRVVAYHIIHGENASLDSRWRVLSDCLQVWDSVQGEAEAAGVNRQLLLRPKRIIVYKHACGNLSRLLREGMTPDVFRYLYHSYPTLDLRVMLKILIRPFKNPQDFMKFSRLLMFGRRTEKKK